MIPFSRRDYEFVLFELLQVEKLLRLPRYQMHDRGTIAEMLDLAERIAEREFLPLAKLMDEVEPQVSGGIAKLDPAVCGALEAYNQAGFVAAAADGSDGGLQFPNCVALLANGIFSSSNLAIQNYSFLTAAAANLLKAHGSLELCSAYLAPMREGRWAGTMCLSEPEAGSSLSNIRTSAQPTENGEYTIRGSKMWISGGDQNITENIIHMVLARTDVENSNNQLSLFLVPKYVVAQDGSIGNENGVSLVGLNHKMGQRGTTNCALSFGDSAPCRGHLIGRPGQGLSYMFHMMNEARIGVGMSATMLGTAGFHYSLHYARQRIQGRKITDRGLSRDQVAIIEHSDVKRMLLAQKAFVEGALALVAHCSYLTDIAEHGEGGERACAKDLVEFLTPIVKSWPSENCLQANHLAIQVLGGCGYTRDFPVERLFRDNRLNSIHEGTLGIQALDFVGRKISSEASEEMLRLVSQTARTALEEADLEPFGNALLKGADVWRDTIKILLECGDQSASYANATLLLNASGHLLVAWHWLSMALISRRKLDLPDCRDRQFYEGKISACRYFFAYELPKALCELDLVGRLDVTCSHMTAEQFAGS